MSDDNMLPFSFPAVQRSVGSASPSGPPRSFRTGAIRTGSPIYRPTFCALASSPLLAAMRTPTISTACAATRLLMLEQSLAVAQSQKARPLELRAATDLARLHRDQSRCAGARDLLAPVYVWFTEGFDTQDLKEAKALLDTLDA